MNLIAVDQCAYGRQAQKPTRILTNIDWNPKGKYNTSGKCVIGRCAGTCDNVPGNKEHTEQIQPTRRERRSHQGQKKRGRREYTLAAVVNMVQPELVQEIYLSVNTRQPNDDD